MATVKLTTIDTSTTTNIVTDLYEGDCYVIDRLVPHQVEALTDCDIIESSTFHRDEDSYRVWRDLIYLFDVDGTLTPPMKKMESGGAMRFLNWMKDKQVYIVAGSDKKKGRPTTASQYSF